MTLPFEINLLPPPAVRVAYRPYNLGALHIDLTYTGIRTDSKHSVSWWVPYSPPSKTVYPHVFLCAHSVTLGDEPALRQDYYYAQPEPHAAIPFLSIMRCLNGRGSFGYVSPYMAEYVLTAMADKHDRGANISLSNPLAFNGTIHPYELVPFVSRDALRQMAEVVDTDGIISGFQYTEASCKPSLSMPSGSMYPWTVPLTPSQRLTLSDRQPGADLFSPAFKQLVFDAFMRITASRFMWEWSADRQDPSMIRSTHALDTAQATHSDAQSAREIVADILHLRDAATSVVVVKTDSEAILLVDSKPVGYLHAPSYALFQLLSLD